eukprot:5808608-Amphidinium_carterae.1
MMQVALEDLHIASDSDVLDDDDPTKTWVQTLEAYQTRGRKRCKICRRRDGLMRRCNNCRHHVHGALHGAFPESMEGSCFLITMNGEFLCRGPNCGTKVTRGRVAVTAAEIQGALQRRGTLQPGDIFPEACLAPAQVVGPK